MTQEVFFSDIRNTIIKNLQNCNYDLKIAMAWFTDEKILSVINDLLIKGVNVTIIIYDDHINRKELFEKLHYNNASIFLSKKLMHNKFCIIDDKTVINGSYNWTNNAKTNDENIQITFNDDLFANKFKIEFDKISSNCKDIEEYFRYSTTNIKYIEIEFKNFYSIWPKYSFPYFINFKDIEINKLNSKLDLEGFVYLILNKEQEKKIFWYFFLSKSKILASKILSITGEKIELPIRFNNVFLNDFDDNSVSLFKNSKCLVEENSNQKKYLYFIDKKGQLISEKIEFNKKVSEDRFLFCESEYTKDKINNSYFVDVNLSKTKIEFVIESIIKNKRDRKSTRLNSSHITISYAVFCLKKKNESQTEQ